MQHAPKNDFLSSSAKQQVEIFLATPWENKYTSQSSVFNSAVRTPGQQKRFSPTSKKANEMG